MNKKFNYILPVFNKEDILPQTLEGIENCAGEDSKIIMIVDGCTDDSERIVDEFSKNSSHKTVKILMPNVHMLLSVNKGLSLVNSGFSVIMQDDIILQERDFEKKVLELYADKNKKIGVSSLRMASNLNVATLKEQVLFRSVSKMLAEVDIIKGPSDYSFRPQGEFENFYPRMSAINGPNIIPWSLLADIGVFDPKLAPYGFDDPEYCLRALKRGYVNGLFPLRYKSEMEWGGTRRSKEYLKQVAKVHMRNRIYIWKQHGEFIKDYWQNQIVKQGYESI